MGINLAHAELYLGLASIWRLWGSKDVRGEDDEGYMELHETGLRDVEMRVMPLCRFNRKARTVLESKSINDLETMVIWGVISISERRNSFFERAIAGGV